MRIKLLILTFLSLFLGVGSVSATNIKINEFYAAGTTSPNPDWVEIYNDGMDISLYQLVDLANNKKDLASATCNGNFCTIDWYNSLNNSGDTIKLTLKTTPDSSVDQVTYPGDVSIPNSEQSAARNPDATGGWFISSSPTKGTTNNISTPSPASIPTSTPTPSDSSPSTNPSSSFTISNPPSEINSDEVFSVSVNLSSPDNPNTSFYFKGAFKKSYSSNYFGQTLVSGNWVKNSSSYTNQYKITTDSLGNWSGSLEVKPDADDLGFTGTDNYIFKVGKYKESDNASVSWSNEVTIKINAVNSVETSSKDQSTTKTDTSSIPKSASSPVIKSSTSSKSTKSNNPPYQTASIAAATSSTTLSASPANEKETQVKQQKFLNLNIWVVLGIFLILAGFGSLGFIFWRSKRWQ